MNMENAAMETEGFEELVARHRTQVFGFVFASVQDVDLAESLTQDCFWRAYRDRHAFRGDSSVRTWLMKIAVNLVRDHTRTRRFQFWRRIRRIDPEDICDLSDRHLSPEEVAVAKDRVRAVWDAANSLSERQRTVFLLRFFDEMDISEIAQSTGLTRNAVNVHLFRAVRAIRKRLGTSI
jgi:RNA polymerase sigma-70 factor (ECF subfamily)